MSVVLEDLIRKRVLPRYPLPVEVVVARLDGGLINQTFLISTPAERFVLQRVNPLFAPAIHANISAVTRALRAAGLVTPVLVPTYDGESCLELEAEDAAETHAVWRLMTYVAGASFDVLAGTAQARAAGALVARFHGALDQLDHTFVGVRASVHDTPRHLEQLASSIRTCVGHRLAAPVAALAEQIWSAVAKLPPLPSLPPRICHGDLKLNNFLFAGATGTERDQAVCLIDLDTVGPLALAFEMGDAWRSWCNRNGEDQEVAELDLTLFEASLDGYRSAIDRALTPGERLALLLGPEWVSLELSVRFAADALAESYFGWNSERFAGRGEHNLTRARGQFSMHQALAASRAARARMLGSG